MKAQLLIAGVCVALLATACDGSGDAAAPTGPTTTSKPPDLSTFVPSEKVKDPSTTIPGIEIRHYLAGQHVGPNQRVAYDQSPPFGGAHDYIWAACNGVVYDVAVRNENMVHPLEHGAVWIAYNPDSVKGADLAALAARVDGKPYMLMSPYPGLDRPVSLQSWGRRLKVDRADDPRIDEFITALRLNRYTNPEPGASCDVLTGYFDPAHPPPFDPSPPGPDAVPATGPAHPTTTTKPASSKPTSTR